MTTALSVLFPTVCNNKPSRAQRSRRHRARRPDCVAWTRSIPGHGQLSIPSIIGHQFRHLVRVITGTAAGQRAPSVCGASCDATLAPQPHHIPPHVPSRAARTVFRRVASSALFSFCRAVLAWKRAFSRWCPVGGAPTLWRRDGRTPPAAITPLHVRFSREFGGSSLSEPSLTARRAINARAFDCGRRHAAGSAGVTTPSDGRTSATPGRAWHPFLLSPLPIYLSPSLCDPSLTRLQRRLFLVKECSHRQVRSAHRPTPPLASTRDTGRGRTRHAPHSALCADSPPLLIGRR